MRRIFLTSGPNANSFGIDTSRLNRDVARSRQVGGEFVDDSSICLQSRLRSGLSFGYRIQHQSPPIGIRFRLAPKFSPNGEVATMIISKSYRTLLALAALGTTAQFAQAGCNCSVPPAPAISADVPMAAPWNGTPIYNNSPGSVSSSAYGMSQQAYSGQDSIGPHWAPGGYEARVGSPAYYHDPAGGQFTVTGNPYYDHFGPGFHRSSLHGHYRFPYYNYRAPWYYPGKAVYNRNTNFAW